MDTLETKRLRLEAWSRRDAEALYEYAKNPAVGPPAGWRPHASIRDSRFVIKKMLIPSGTWKIVFRETGMPIGTIGFDTDKRRPNIKSRELGYSMDQRYWGRGLMPEAAEAVIEYGFNVLGLEIIAITTGPDNSRSRRVIEKLGFKYEGTERYAYRIYNDTVRDLMCFSMFREEWLKARE